MKDWTGDKISVFKTGGFANDSVQERQVDDYYATDPKALEGLLIKESFSNVWECACGGGHLSEVLIKHGIHGKSTDKFDRGYGEVEDFLLSGYKHDGDIITNPPYRYAEEFIRKSLDILEDGRKLALLLPLRYLEGKKRKLLFDEFPPCRVYVFSYRINCAIDGNFDRRHSSPICYSWFIWEKGVKNISQLYWI
jgi:hypothetical protein